MARIAGGQPDDRRHRVFPPRHVLPARVGGVSRDAPFRGGIVQDAGGRNGVGKSSQTRSARRRVHDQEWQGTQIPIAQ